MARKKNESTVVDETKLQNQENTEAVQTQNDETNTQTVEDPAVQNPAVQTVAPETTETNTKASMAKPVEIPDAVKKLLALYPNHSALYVNAKGGVFPKNAQPSLVKDAILYQNPYFKQ